LEWRFKTPYRVFGVDETTSAEKLSGGFSPITFASGKRSIRYGIITKCLFKRGKTERIPTEEGMIEDIIGYGANLLLDEINRTPFPEISFLLSFLAKNPASYEIQEEGRVVYNPNFLPELGKESRWVLFGTMNTMDIGNNQLAYAFKRRAMMIKTDYFAYSDSRLKRGLTTTGNPYLDILREKIKVMPNSYEEKIFKDIYDNIKSWQVNEEITYPCAIDHYLKFFKYLRNGLKKVKVKNDVLYIGDTDISLERYIISILRSTIVMPVVNENNREIVTEKENLTKEYAKKYAKDIKSVIDSGEKLMVVQF